MHRTVSSHLEVSAISPCTLVLEIAVAACYQVTETLSVVASGQALTPRELLSDHGARWHVVDVAAGPVTVHYEAEIEDKVAPIEVAEIDLHAYVRPSRYCESDSLAPTARAQFGGLAGMELLAAVSSWVGTQLSYVPGSSLPTDGAVRTMLARQGVCRDYAHLVVALLRALDVPARLVSVYAPGLQPMDFHAVAEAFVDDAWYVVDATTLAPRSTLVRIATGRDAADTAFLSIHNGQATLDSVTVTAVVDALPADDITQPVTIG